MDNVAVETEARERVPVAEPVRSEPAELPPQSEEGQADELCHEGSAYSPEGSYARLLVDSAHRHLSSA